MHTCAWCGTGYAEFRPRCESCGGALPAAPGAPPVDPPPPPPRALPPGFRRRVLYTKNVMTMIGLGFTGIGGFLTLIFAIIAIAGREPSLFLGAGFSALFLTGGIFMLRFGLRRGRGILLAFEHGVATQGRVTDVYLDTSIKINNRSPWAVEYAFEAGGRSVRGKAHAWDADLVQELHAGGPVHVLYVENDPERSTLYPPMS